MKSASMPAYIRVMMDNNLLTIKSKILEQPDILRCLTQKGMLVESDEGKFIPPAAYVSQFYNGDISEEKMTHYDPAPPSIPRTDGEPQQLRIVTHKDGSIQVDGLLPNQRVERSEDGKLQLITLPADDGHPRPIPNRPMDMGADAPRLPRPGPGMPWLQEHEIYSSKVGRKDISHDYSPSEPQDDDDTDTTWGQTSAAQFTGKRRGRSYGSSIGKSPVKHDVDNENSICYNDGDVQVGAMVPLGLAGGRKESFSGGPSEPKIRRKSEKPTEFNVALPTKHKTAEQRHNELVDSAEWLRQQLFKRRSELEADMEIEARTEIAQVMARAKKSPSSELKASRQQEKSSTKVHRDQKHLQPKSKPIVKKESIPQESSRPQKPQKVVRKSEPKDKSDRSSSKNRDPKDKETRKKQGKDGDTYCHCRTAYDPRKFYIGCDLCNNWFHGSCVGISEKTAKTMDSWMCDDCQSQRRNTEEQLYCICRTAYDDKKFYVGCDGCFDWFHGTCVGVTKAQADKQAIWLCEKCTNSKENKDKENTRMPKKKRSQPEISPSRPKQRKEKEEKKSHEKTRDELAESKLARAMESHELNEMDYQLISRMFKQVRLHKMAWPFHDPVDERQVPDYYSVIEVPMDMGKVDKRVQSRQYKTLSEFHLDMSRIFNNCRSYNRPDTTFFQCANVVETFYTHRFKPVRQRILSSYV